MDNLFDKIYQRFILRDFLSFIIPGAIVISALLFIRFDFHQMLDFANKVPLILYILIIGIMYITGFAVQCLAAEIIDGIVRKLTFDRIRLYRFNYQKKDEDSYHLQQKFFSVANDDEKQVFERFIILKLMCGNNAFALLIAIVLIGIKYFIPCICKWTYFATIIVIFVSLYWGHFVHVKRWEKWNITVCDREHENE